ncbi:hypothetical protein JOM56_014486 [Amanita muscaria]
MPNDSSPESMKLLLIYPSLVLTTLALTTSSMFIAHFEGETHHDYRDTQHASSARSIVFAIPVTTLVWGVFLALAWIAYTTLNTTSQFTHVARMGMMWRFVSILVPIVFISVAFGTYSNRTWSRRFLISGVRIWLSELLAETRTGSKHILPSGVPDY